MQPSTAASHAAQLLRQAQHGDRSAFGQLVLTLQDRLYNAVLRMAGHPDDARELTQETFMRALQKLDTFRGDAHPYTWLFRIATNLVITEARKAHRHRTFSLDGSAGRNGRSRGAGDEQASSLADRLAAATDSPHGTAESRERQSQVLAALDRIDAEYRAILVMRDIEDFDYQQMADVLSLPLGTVKSRLFRARKALRDELQHYITTH